MLLALMLDDPGVQSALQTIVLAVISLLGTVLAGLIAWAGASIKKWLANKAHGEAFVTATTKLEKLTRNAVSEVEQTLVRQLKAEEKWNADTAKQARDTAVEIALRHLGEHGRGVVEDALELGAAELRGMLRTYVEGHVHSMGATGNSSPLVPLGE